MKKKNSIGRIVSGIIIVILLVASSLVFVAYQKLNNSKQFEETFFTDNTKEYEFKDLVTYNTTTHIAHVEVPKDAFKKFVDDILEDVYLPYGLTINRAGLMLNEDQTITVIPEIRYKNLIATCPQITISYVINEDHIDFIYEGIYLVNAKLSEVINERSGLETGVTIASVSFPDVIMDFHQCPFKPEYISNINCDKESISCDYDIYRALLERYKTDTTTGEDNPWFQESISSLKNLASRGYKITE